MLRKSRSVSIVFGLLISALCLWFTFKNVDGKEFIAALRQVKPFWLLAAITCSTLCFPLRIPRWRLLLPQNPQAPIPTTTLWHAISIGFTANNVIPLRIGEVIRAALLTRLTTIPFGTSFASLAVERALDGLFMIALLGVGLLVAKLPPGLTLPSGIPVSQLILQLGVMCVAIFLLVLFIAWRPAIVLRLLQRSAPRNKVGEKLLQFAERVLEGVAALRDPRRAIPVLGWSLALWLVNGLSFWFGFLAFSIPMNVFVAFVIQGLVSVFIAIPGAPGGLGQFEAAIKTGLVLYGIDPNLAAAYAVGFHLTTLPPILLLGARSLHQVGWSMVRLPQAANL